IAVCGAGYCSELDLHRLQPEHDVDAVLAALRAGQEPPYWNTLEGPVFRLEPALAELKRELKKTGLFGVLMSGSGSTLFGLAKDAGEAGFIARKLQERYPNFWVRATQTLS
ncbi:MAG: 4-(cytidine 5'-diphospho)-2-C-methyl-D-erythritol kinase, partial [Thermaceae bacterium]|nr:4-(cytidine 5'-diphospho)-2-C-methyl-D-erythritol kinase [Thermaceae bacterium]